MVLLRRELLFTASGVAFMIGDGNANRPAPTGVTSSSRSPSRCSPDDECRPVADPREASGRTRNTETRALHPVKEATRAF